MNSRPENPAPETLLTHQDFVRGLVRSLLRGAEGEDDVVQNTWMRALTSPRRDTDSGRQWLARVARNMARDYQRGRTRRTSHERRAAPPEDLPSVADVVHREQERKRVVDAVLGLSEPYRTAVLLRYWEEIPSRAIAARLGIPDATVRSHLRRGLEMLRQKLDAEYGSRDRWVVALTPCAAFSQAAKTSAGTILMTTKAKTLLTACCLSIAGLAFLGMYGFAGVTPPLDGPAISPVKEASDTSRQDEGSTPGATSSDRTIDRRSPIASSGAFTLAGSVTDDGHPVADLVLNVQWFRGYDVNGSPDLAAPVRTDAAGAFVWRGPLPDAVSLVRAVTANPHFKLICEPELVLPDQVNARLAMRVIPLDCELYGVVSNDAGDAIEGARIATGNGAGPRAGTETDSRGRYSLRVGRAQHSQRVSIWAPDCTPQTVSTHIPATSDRYRLDFSLQVGARIAGRVVDAAGSPLAGVRVRTHGSKYQLMTGAEGRFEFISLSPARDHHIEVSMAGYLPLGKTFAVGTNDAEITLQRGPVLFGRVLDAEGRGLAGAKIRSGEQTGYSAADGSFRLGGIREGKCYVIVTRSGFVRAWHELVMPADRLELIARLEPADNIRGQVTDTAGVPIAGASVHLAFRVQGTVSMGEPSARSDANGEFEILGVSAAKTVEIGAFKRGFRRSIVSNVVAGPAKIEIRLERGASIAGRVLSRATKRPIGRFRLRIATEDHDNAFGNAATTIEGTDGYWESRIKAYEVGQALYVRIEAEGFAPSRATATAATHPPRDQTVILMEQAATVVGTVRDKDSGKPVAGATIMVVDGPAKDLVFRLLHARSVTSDESGRYEITSLGAGPLRLVVTHPDYTDKICVPIEIHTGQRPNTINLQLDRGSSLRGRIEGFDGLDLDVQILSYEGRRNSQTLKLGAKRDYLFKGLGEGSHLISISTKEQSLLRAAFVVIADADVADFVLRELEGPCSVTVRVTGLDAGKGRSRPKKGE